MKVSFTYDNKYSDITPVRLRGGRKAYVLIPLDFYMEDVEAITQWLEFYITPRKLPAPPPEETQP